MYGSKKLLMMKIFQNKRMPFYKFGETVFLDKIPNDDWVKYIQERFLYGGKKDTKTYTFPNQSIAGGSAVCSPVVQEKNSFLLAYTEKCS